MTIRPRLTPRTAISGPLATEGRQRILEILRAPLSSSTPPHRSLLQQQQIGNDHDQATARQNNTG